jgi:hypothetical protein
MPVSFERGRVIPDVMDHLLNYKKFDYLYLIINKVISTKRCQAFCPVGI